MADLANLVIRVQTLEAKMAKKDLEDLARSGGRAESAVDGLSYAAKRLAAAFAAFKVGQYIKDAGLLAARYETLGVVMEQVGKNAGYSADQMRGYEQALRKTGISAVESRDTLTRLVQANIDLSQATGLARIAQDAAVIGNINSSEAFDRLVYGIQSAQTEVLRTIGINVNFENSYKRLAAQLGKATKDLTEHEKMQARVNAVYESGLGIRGTYERSMDTAGKKLGSLTRHYKDFKTEFGTPLLPAVGIIVDEITETMKALTKHVSDPAIQKGFEGIATSIARSIKNFSDWATEIDKADIDKFATGVENLGKSFEALPGFVRSATDEIKELSDAWSAIPEGFRSMLIGGAAGFALGGAKGARFGMALGGTLHLKKAVQESAEAYENMGFWEWVWSNREDIQQRKRNSPDTESMRGARTSTSSVVPDLAEEIAAHSIQVYSKALSSLGMTDAQLRGITDPWMRGGRSEMESYIIEERESRAKKAQEQDWLKAYGMDEGALKASVQEANKRLWDMTVKAIENDTKYAFGAKVLSSKSIDCSGFVEEAYRQLIHDLGDQAKNSGLDSEMAKALTGSSEDIIANVENIIGKSGTLKESASALSMAALKPGMLIGLDTGPAGFDSDRTYGIDHIVMVLEDIKGTLKIAQSSSSGGGVNIQDAETYLSKMGSAKAFVVDPLHDVRGKLDDGLREYQRYADEVSNVQQRLTDEINQKNMDQFEYKRWAMEQEIEEIRRSDAYVASSVEKRMQLEEQLANFRLESLKSISQEEEKYLQQEAERREKDAERVRQEALSNASSFAEYHGLMSADTTKRQADAQRQIWRDMHSEYESMSGEMTQLRIAAYDEILAHAMAVGNQELAMFAQVNKEAAMLGALQNLQKYGSPEEAFNATIQIDFGTYKSELSKARDLSVQYASTVKGLFEDLGTAIGGGVKDAISGLIDGTMTIEEALSNMLGRIADAFMDFAMKIFGAWIQNQLGEIFGSMFGSSLGGGGGGGFDWGAAVGEGVSLLGSFFGGGYAQGGQFPGGIPGHSGLVTRPTLFAFAQGGAGQFGLMGEAGPEVIMPAVRMPDGQFGVRVQGQGDQQAPHVENHTKIVNVLDPGLVGEFMRTDEGENMVVNIVQRNKGMLS